MLQLLRALSAAHAQTEQGAAEATQALTALATGLFASPEPKAMPTAAEVARKINDETLTDVGLCIRAGDMARLGALLYSDPALANVSVRKRLGVVALGPAGSAHGMIAATVRLHVSPLAWLLTPTIASPAAAAAAAVGEIKVKDGTIESMFALLLKHKADIDGRYALASDPGTLLPATNLQQLPLALAIHSHWLQLSEQLIELGADFVCALSRADGKAAGGASGKCSILQAAVGASGKCSILEAAVVGDWLGPLSQLLAHAPDAVASYRTSCARQMPVVVLATRHRSWCALTMLLAHGLSPDVEDKHSDTALHVMAAMPEDTAALVDLLLCKGANTSLKNADGLTAAQIAAAHKNATVRRALERNASLVG